MDVDEHGNKRVFQRLGASNDSGKQHKVCYHWRAGRCNKFPCPYLHRELPAPPPQQHQPFISNGSSSKRPNQGVHDDRSFSGARRSPNFNPTWGRVHGAGAGNRAQGSGAGNRVFRKIEKLCNYWLQGNCSYGEKCKFLHSWSVGDCFSSLTQLEGHQKVVSGIALPSGSDKLYTGSKDETVRIWDCQSGQCTGVVNLGGEVGCMISEGPWLFVGIPNVVKAWHTQNNTELSLSGPTGQVYALVVGNDLLFAGVQDGAILAWKFNAVSNCFEPAASLKGHTQSVITLVIGIREEERNFFYQGYRLPCLVFMDSVMEDDCEWAWLPKDLLHSILDQLQPMEDLIRFSAVCTEWRSVAVANFESRSLHRRQVPFLMSRTKDNIGNLHSVTQKKMYKFRFPMPHNTKCCGSSLGWLIMLDVTMDVILFNPFSGNTITFPPIRRLVFEKRYALEFDYIHGLSALKRYEYEIRIREEYGEEELGLSVDDMTLDFEDDYEIQGEEKTDEEEEEKEEGEEREVGSECRIIKGVLSADPSVCPDDYVLMVIYGVENRLAFIKSGDEDWTYIDDKTSGFDYLFKTSPRVKGFRYFEDILYWKSQFYAVDRLGKLLSCEINTNFTTLRVKIVDVPKRGIGADPISTSTSFQEVVQSLREDVQSPFFEGSIRVWSAFLVESVEGDLLWVPKFRSNFLTRKFCVYKLVDNGGNVGWVEKEDLGDASLFLGDNHSILVRCQPSSIYFVDKEDETVWCYPGYPFDMGVYNLEHKAVARDYQLNPSQRLNPPPIWILPTFM